MDQRTPSPVSQSLLGLPASMAIQADVRWSLPSNLAGKGFVHLGATCASKTTMGVTRMKRQFRFNKRSIEALPPCPPDARSKEIEYADTEVSGLRLQVNKVGRKAFLFRYQISGRKRAMKVGG